MYVVPALGGYERRVASFGFLPRWSPDGTLILFTTSMLGGLEAPRMFTVGLDGSAPKEVLQPFLSAFEARGNSVVGPAAMAWHPDGRISFWGWHRAEGDSFWTAALDGRRPTKSEIDPDVEQRWKQLLLRRMGHRITWDRTGAARVGGPHRLTTGAGADDSIALSANGRALAFTSATTVNASSPFPSITRAAASLIVRRRTPPSTWKHMGRT